MEDLTCQTDLINSKTRDMVLAEFQSRFGASPDYLLRSPGRVNLLGEHIDYNDGIVLPFAIDRATWLAFSANGSGQSNLLALDLGQSCSFTPASIQIKQDNLGSLLPEWVLYPAGVNWAAGNANLACVGMNAVYSSTIPAGSGLSSSASIEMAFALAWQTLSAWGLSPMQRALLGKEAENLYVGVHSGIMDQFACACGKANSVLALDCRSLEWHTIPLPPGYTIIVANSMKPRKLSGGEYNKRKADCEEAVRLLGIKSLRDISLKEFYQLSHIMPERIRKRAKHVVEETDRVIRAIRLLEDGDLGEFGKLLNEGHVSLRDLFEVSTPELNLMVELAQALPGCLGSRLTGAGFGGCTISIVTDNQTEGFIDQLRQGYQKATGIMPDVYVCRASEGTCLI